MQFKSKGLNFTWWALEGKILFFFKDFLSNLREKKVYFFQESFSYVKNLILLDLLKIKEFIVLQKHIVTQVAFHTVHSDWFEIQVWFIWITEHCFPNLILLKKTLMCSLGEFLYSLLLI